MTDRFLPYYKWFWQDYRANRKVQRMTYIERGLYRELLDECWIEGSIPKSISDLADICGCPEEVMANAWQMLSKCFIKVGDKYENEKLNSMRTERDQIRVIRSQAGKAGGQAKVANANKVQANASKCHIEEVEGESESKGESKKTTKPKNSIEKPMDVSNEVWQDFLVTRKSHKAPLTQTALNGIRKEGEKIGWSLEDTLKQCCARNWRSFDSSWVNKSVDQYRPTTYNQPQTPSKTMQGIMLLQQEIDRLNNEGTENEILEN
jgi:uncharacterized protein YdaU (DUF1376 family)